jgi:hypothetical protein
MVAAKSRRKIANVNEPFSFQLDMLLCLQEATKESPEDKK